MSWVTNSSVTPKLLPHRADQVLQIGPGLRVDRGERLVHQQDPRLEGQRPGDGDPLLHAAGQLPRVGAARRRRGRPRRAPRLDQRRSAQPGRQPFGLQRQFDVLVHLQPGEQAAPVLLEHDRRRRRAGRPPARRPPGPSPAVGASRPPRQRSRVVLPQPDGPTTQTNCPAATSKVMFRERLDLAAVAVVDLAQTADLQHSTPLLRAALGRANPVVPAQYPALDQPEQQRQHHPDEAEQRARRSTSPGSGSRAGTRRSIAQPVAGSPHRWSTSCLLPRSDPDCHGRSRRCPGNRPG